MRNFFFVWFVFAASLCVASDDHSYWDILQNQTEFNVKLQDHSKPLFELETLMPFYQTPCCDHTLFWQGRLAHWGDGDTYYDLGVGYRYLFRDCLLLGFNTFFDTTRKDWHRRISFGLEAMYCNVTMRGHFYFPTAGEKTVRTRSKIFDGVECPSFSEETWEIRERRMEAALRGGNIEIEAPLPHYPWARVILGGFRFKGRDFDDVHGYYARGLLNITRCFRVELGRRADNERHDNYVKLVFSIRPPCDREYTACNSYMMPTFFSSRNLRRQTLTHVRRLDYPQIERYYHTSHHVVESEEHENPVVN